MEFYSLYKLWFIIFQVWTHHFNFHLLKGPSNLNLNSLLRDIILWFQFPFPLSRTIIFSSSFHFWLYKCFIPSVNLETFLSLPDYAEICCLFLYRKMGHLFSMMHEPEVSERESLLRSLEKDISKNNLNTVYKV